MHNIEPYYNWRHIYVASEDEHSPFFGKEYSEFEFSNTIYNYYIHPQWDDIGSPTLYLKLLYADYINGYAIMELIGEWNDAINNDIMFLKENVINQLEIAGINKFILLGENVLNFHASDNCYYEDWYEDVIDGGGWLVAMNFREHIIDEMNNTGIQHYLYSGFKYNNIPWRTYEPSQLLMMVENIIPKPIDQSIH